MADAALPNPVVLFLALVISLAVFVPCTGVLVRFRANYNPKGLQLDAEGGAAPHTGPIIDTYFGMFKRVYRLEGWSGLYKGLMPNAISTLIVSIVIILFVETTQPRHGKYRAPETGVMGTLVYSCGMLILSLPTAVLTYRAITTPHRLSYFDLMRSLRILLTPTERRKPWILYFTPGLMAAEVSHIAVIVLFLAPARRLLLPNSSLEGRASNISYVKLTIYLILVAASIAVLTPLEVIATRLAIQRNHASAEYTAAQEADGDTEDTEYTSPDEDVIGLRNEGDPYLGLVDCAKRIVDEEGWKALYRAWWISLLGVLGSSFA